MRQLLVPLLIAALCASNASAADARMTFLFRQLEKATDPRGRAQAALMLGASKDPSVVQPLCGALARDGSDLVRAAAAKGLSQAGQGAAVGCLQARKSDPNAEVRAAVHSALAALAGSARRPALYIAMKPVVDKTSRLSPEIMRMANEHLRAQLSNIGSVFAPTAESKTAAQSVLKQKRLRGYQLVAELEQNPNGTLTMSLLCLTYPDLSVKGTVSVKARGGGPADMIRALAPKLIEEAADTFEWSN
jgi:hypothetical protein